MNIEVRLFAAAKDAAGNAMVSLTVPEHTTVAELRQHLVAAAPALATMQQTLFVAVNNQYANADDVIRATDEIACFPPVSGG